MAAVVVGGALALVRTGAPVLRAAASGGALSVGISPPASLPANSSDLVFQFSVTNASAASGVPITVAFAFNGSALSIPAGKAECSPVSGAWTSSGGDCVDAGGLGSGQSATFDMTFSDLPSNPGDAVSVTAKASDGAGDGGQATFNGQVAAAPTPSGGGSSTSTSSIVVSTSSTTTETTTSSTTTSSTTSRSSSTTSRTSSTTTTRSTSSTTSAPVQAPPNSFPEQQSTVTVKGGSPTSNTSNDGDVTLTVDVPANALPSGTQVSVFKGSTRVLSESLPDGTVIVAGYAVAWTAPDGSHPDAKAPITFTIVDATITPGTFVYQTTATGLVRIDAVVTAGKAVVTFTHDPGFVLAQAAEAAPPPPPDVPQAGTIGTPTVGGGPAAEGSSAGLFTALATVALALGVTTAVALRRRTAG